MYTIFHPSSNALKDCILDNAQYKGEKFERTFLSALSDKVKKMS